MARKCEVCGGNMQVKLREGCTSERHKEINEKVKEHKRAYMKEYGEKNREVLLAKKREYGIAHREELRVKKREYWYKNREKLIVKKREYYAKNREHLLANQKAYHNEHRERYRKNRLEKQYGISFDDVDRMIESQNGLCLICGKELGDKYVIDHDHESGEVRGVLHSNCNILIGFIETVGASDELFDNVRSYLMKQVGV